MEDVQLYLLVLLAAIVGIWSFYFSDLYEHATMRSRQSVLVAGLRGLGISALLLSPLVWLLAGDRRMRDHFMEPALGAGIGSAVRAAKDFRLVASAHEQRGTGVAGGLRNHGAIAGRGTGGQVRITAEACRSGARP